MNWKKNKKYVLSLLLCAPVIFAGCGSDDDGGGGDGETPPLTLTGLTDTEATVARRAIGTTEDGKKWSAKTDGVTQTGGPDPQTGALTGWNDFKLTLKAGDAVDGKSVITFAATVPTDAQSSHATVWPASGTLAIGTISGDDIAITRTGDANFTNASITTNSAGDELSIVFTVTEAASSGRQASSLNSRVGGNPVATWTFALEEDTE